MFKSVLEAMGKHPLKARSLYHDALFGAEKECAALPRHRHTFTQRMLLVANDSSKFLYPCTGIYHPFRPVSKGNFQICPVGFSANFTSLIWTAGREDFGEAGMLAWLRLLRPFADPKSACS